MAHSHPWRQVLWRLCFGKEYMRMVVAVLMRVFTLLKRRTYLGQICPLAQSILQLKTTVSIDWLKGYICQQPYLPNLVPRKPAAQAIRNSMGFYYIRSMSASKKTKDFCMRQLIFILSELAARSLFYLAGSIWLCRVCIKNSDILSQNSIILLYLSYKLRYLVYIQ